MLYKRFPREVLRDLSAGEVDDPTTPLIAQSLIDTDPR